MTAKQLDSMQNAGQVNCSLYRERSLKAFCLRVPASLVTKSTISVTATRTFFLTTFANLLTETFIMASLLPEKGSLRLLATAIEVLFCIVIVVIGCPFLLGYILDNDKAAYLSDSRPFIIGQWDLFKSRSSGVLLRLSLFVVPYTLFVLLIGLPTYHLMHNLGPGLLENDIFNILWFPFQLMIDFVTCRLSLKVEIGRLKRELEASQKLAQARLKRNAIDRAKITNLTTRRADRKHGAHLPKTFNWTLTPELVAAGERVWTCGAGSDQLPAIQTLDGAKPIEASALSPEDPQDPQDHCCAICWADFVYDENVELLPCGHVLHKDCIKPWLKQNFSCPRCQREFVWVMALKPEGVIMKGRK